MMDKSTTPVRLNLVEPLAHEATAMRTTDTGEQFSLWSGAVSRPIGGDHLGLGDVDRSTGRSTRATTPSSSISRTAIATTTTRTTSSSCELFADSLFAPAASADRAPFSMADLVQAWLDCRRSKRHSASALAFEQHLEANLCALHDELLVGRWRPGQSVCFVVTRPRPREVWAAQFRDRIVHHLMYNAIAPRIEASFIHASCACIAGRGTLFAAELLERGVRSITQNWSRPAWYLKCDLANFFVSIDKRVLLDQLRRRIAPGWWLDLATTVLMHDPRADVVLQSTPALMRLVPEHKRLFNAPADTGLPIGNLSSQFFANVYLDALDQFAKHHLRARHYVRYVDDFCLLHESPQALNAALAEISAFLPSRLHVRLNPRKTILQPVARGIDFVGHLVKPWRRTTRAKTLARALARIETMPVAETHAAGNSYLGLVRQASHSHRDQALIANALRRRGHTIDGNLTRVFRRKGIDQ